MDPFIAISYPDCGNFIDSQAQGNLRTHGGMAAEKRPVYHHHPAGFPLAYPVGGNQRIS